MTVQPHPAAPHVPAPPSPVCPIGPEGRHRFRAKGYWPGTARCSSPVRLVCLNCSERAAVDCGTRHQGRCGNCSHRYARRLTRAAHYGLNVPGRSAAAGWTVGMLTITAPGVEGHQRFVPGRPGKHGTCNCATFASPDSGGIARWNATVAARWNHLRTALVRAYPGLEFFKATEVQKRGALHLHALVAVPGSLDLRAVQTLALGAGFGCVLHFAPVEPGSRRLAYYVAKYVTKDAEPGQVPWARDVVDQRTGEITTEHLARFRPWTSSQHWGLTMTELKKLARVAGARAAAARAVLESVESAGIFAGGEGVGALSSGPLDSG